MLPVDVNELYPELPQDRRRHGASVHAAGAFAALGNFALDLQLVRIIRHLIVREPRKLRHAGKNGAHECALCARADAVAVGAFAEDGGDGVDNDGFARAGLAGERIEAAVKADLCLLNNGYIFDMQNTQHNASPYFAATWLRISAHRFAALGVSRSTANAVSSPASVPTISGMFMASSAAMAAFAMPTIVLMTRMFCA